VFTRPSKGEPRTEWNQDRGDDEVEGFRAREELHANHGPADDPRQRAEDEQAHERRAQLPGAVVLSQGTGDRDQAVEQVGRRDRRARYLQHADLDRDQEDSTRHPDRRGQHGEGERDQGAERDVGQHPGRLWMRHGEEMPRTSLNEKPS
jgi:hypothetical protein